MNKFDNNFRITEKLLIIILFFAIFPLIFLVYFSSKRIFDFLKKQNQTYYHSLIKQLNDNMDFLKNQYGNGINEIISNENFKLIIEKDFEDEIEKIRFFSKIGENYKNPKSNSIASIIQNKITGSVSIIKIKKGVSNIAYSSDDFFLLNLTQVTLDPLFRRLENNKGKLVLGNLKKGCVITKNRGESAFLYRFSYKKDVDVVFMIIFNENIFLNLYKHIADLQKGFLFIIDRYDNLMHANWGIDGIKKDKSDDNIAEKILLSPEIDVIVYKSYQNANNVIATDIITYKNVKYLALSQYQKITDCKFIYLISLKEINSPVYRLISYIFLTTAILIFLIGVSSAFFSVFFAKPIENKTQSLRDENIYFMNLAHEIKTPLTLISNYLDKYIKSVTITEELKIIKQNIDKLQRDMLNFLDAGKLERGQIFYDNDRSINLSDFLVKKIELYKETALKKNIAIDSAIEEEVYANIDPLAMDRIVNNLVDNAVKYTRPNGKISITLKKNKDRAEFIVSDNGIGITEEQLKYLFKPFHQIAREKRAVQGVGLGLYIIGKIIESVKGEIIVKSELNKGSIFIVRLRVSRVEKGANLSDNDFRSDAILDSTSVILNVEDGEFRENKATLLIVEDNKDLLSYLKKSFEAEYNVAVAENGLKALEKIEKIRKPDLIVSDLMMDGLNGYDFFVKLSSDLRFNDIPFIFLSAVTSFNEKLKILETGAVDFINKPFSTEELRFKINSIVKYQNMKKILYEKDKYASIGMLLGGISHEIFNPLAGIYGPLENLEKIIDKNIPEENKKTSGYFDTIFKNAKRIENIVKSLKILYYNKPYEKESVDISKIISSLKEILQNKIRDNIEIIEEIDNDFTLETNVGFFTQILLNLISNSIDAINGKGIIKILCRKENDKKYIIIADNGKGIPENIKDSIFNAFFTTKEIGKGTGLGLYMVKDMVMKLGWDIRVESNIDKGTEFIITI
ncbi:MAG TPA: ATP-binding protein [Spirochaetota bacterium]|nr:ATP-binding protein [Spirochaetota bacterium]